MGFMGNLCSDSHVIIEGLEGVFINKNNLCRYNLGILPIGASARSIFYSNVGMHRKQFLQRSIYTR